MGVRRAMEIVLAEANKKREHPLYTFGPLIHNNQVLDLLASKGVCSVEDLDGIQSGEIVIRAHGIPPSQRQMISSSGLKTIDATCPKVARVQAIIRSQSRKGRIPVIVGDKDHAEVIGLMGYSEGPVHVLQQVNDVAQLPNLEKLFVVAQTTQNHQNFEAVVKALKDKFSDVLVFDTICDATQERQQEVRELTGQVDAVVVVGGYHSGNTRRLAQISREAGLPTFHIETEKDLDRELLSGMEIVGVTAGASTPNWMIKNVVREIESIRAHGEFPFLHIIREGLNFLVLSNLLACIGAFSFAYAAGILSERPPGFILPLMASLYIFAMHVINRFLDKGASAYNDPARAAFLRKHRSLLILSGIGAIGLALMLSLGLGLSTFIAMCGLSLLGIIYSVPLMPAKTGRRYSYSKIKDIPGSRGISESLAWVAVITIVPLLETEQISAGSALTASCVVFSMSYARAILFNIFQAQGDLIVGSETLPITLGEKKTLVLLKIILVFTGTTLVIAPSLGMVPAFSYLVLIPLGALWICMKAYEKRWVYPGPGLEAMVEAIFLISGLLAVGWQFF